MSTIGSVATITVRHGSVASDSAARTHGWRHDAAAGVRAMVPWLLGVAPYGLVIGVSASQAGIPTAAGWLTGPPARLLQATTTDRFAPGEVPLVGDRDEVAQRSDLEVGRRWKACRPIGWLFHALLMLIPAKQVLDSARQRMDRRCGTMLAEGADAWRHRQ
jgi:hypothetical protein